MAGEDESDKIDESDPLYSGSITWRVDELGGGNQDAEVVVVVEEGGESPPPEEYVAVCLDYYHDPNLPGAMASGVRPNGIWVGPSHGNHYDGALGEATAHEHPGAQVAIELPGDWYQLTGEPYVRHLY
ncbi:hypothetical protein GCM10027280_15030 [Micromonospora polyrhachis]|uniref:Uncharacterized protein n=1 Tax=Micromonospora polyrhachis TaxID=1282883 RepID=A0A7W7WPE7_9ACTN|nr:hypothetical protein [Micromonospora polyrhachis]MBB4958609.1 hypothetical protein [Micromonospora polyrhachis]